MDGSGNVYVAGSSYATWGSPVRGFSGRAAASVAKLDGSGALQWNTFLGIGPDPLGAVLRFGIPILIVVVVVTVVVVVWLFGRLRGRREVAMGDGGLMRGLAPEVSPAVPRLLFCRSVLFILVRGKLMSVHTSRSISLQRKETGIGAIWTIARWLKDCACSFTGAWRV